MVESPTAPLLLHQVETLFGDGCGIDEEISLGAALNGYLGWGCTGDRGIDGEVRHVYALWHQVPPGGLRKDTLSGFRRGDGAEVCLPPMSRCVPGGHDRASAGPNRIGGEELHELGVGEHIHLEIPDEILLGPRQKLLSGTALCT